MLQALRRLFTGDLFSQEYLCLAENSMERPFLMQIQAGDATTDITNLHLLLGYKPVILGIDAACFANKSLPKEAAMVVSSHMNGEEVASLQLSMLATQSVPELVLYEVVSARHRFTGRLQHFVQHLLDERKRNRIGNVFLDQTGYDAVRIAYSIPRRISLVSLCDGSRFNLFPTDLHGQFPGGYTDSFRIAGQAAEQVRRLGKMVVCHVQAEAYTTAYSLGKNHMRPMGGKAGYPFSERVSKNLGWPLPEYTLGYEELELLSFVDAGIHRIFYFRVIHSEPIRSGNTLAHVHSIPASWMERHAAGANYLLRSPLQPA